MKCPICEKDVELQKKQVGVDDQGEPIFHQYAICRDCKKQWDLDKQRARKAVPAQSGGAPPAGKPVQKQETADKAASAKPSQEQKAVRKPALEKDVSGQISSDKKVQQGTAPGKAAPEKKMAVEEATPEGKAKQKAAAAEATPEGKAKQKAAAEATPEGKAKQKAAAEAAPEGKAKQKAAAEATPEGKAKQKAAAEATPEGKAKQKAAAAETTPEGKAKQKAAAAEATPEGKAKQKPVSAELSHGKKANKKPASAAQPSEGKAKQKAAAAEPSAEKRANKKAVSEEQTEERKIRRKPVSGESASINDAGRKSVKKEQPISGNTDVAVSSAGRPKREGAKKGSAASGKQRYGNIPPDKVRAKKEHAVRKGYEDMLSADPNYKPPKKKRSVSEKDNMLSGGRRRHVSDKHRPRTKEELEDSYEKNGDMEYEETKGRFHILRIFFGIFSIVAAGFFAYGGFFTGLDNIASGSTASTGTAFIVYGICMLVSGLVLIILQNSNSIIVFVLPMLAYFGGAVFAFLNRQDEAMLLFCAVIGAVLGIVFLILGIISRNSGYDDSADYDDPFDGDYE